MIERLLFLVGLAFILIACISAVQLLLLPFRKPPE